MVGDVSGTVFHDFNANGTDDAGDSGIPGVTVFIDMNASGTLNPGEPSAVTDNKGKYLIGNVSAGVREVYEIPPAGYIPTPGFTDHRTVQVRDRKETKVKFGNVPGEAARGSIIGEVYVDENENGLNDSGEDGLIGWTMFIDQNRDGLLSDGEPTATTDFKGNYRFDDMAAGTYAVHQLTKGNYRPITGGLFPAEGAVAFKSVDVVGGTTVRANFANKIIPIGNIQGTVVHDLNGDGIRVEADVPMSGITVYVDVNNNSLLDVSEPSRVTDANGSYSFIGIRGGSHRIVEVLSSPFVAATPSPASAVVSVTEGSNVTLNYFNLIPTVGTISGQVYNDADGSGTLNGAEVGLAGWTVFVDANGNGSLDAVERQTTTAAGGSYQFTDLAYGPNSIAVIVPTEWAATNPVSSSVMVMLLNGENRTSVHLGARERIGTIRGSVWNDDNGDGTIASSEAGIADRTVYLDLNLNGSRDEAEPTSVTSATGSYEFSRLRVGTYQVAEELPDGWISSVDKPLSITSQLSIGQTNVVDFYNLTPRLGAISGIIFSDLNSSGVQDTGEVGMVGMQVWADINGNGSLDETDPLAITDASGNYTLNNVPYGNTIVRQILLSSYIPINHAGGIAPVMLLNGEHRTGLDFATREPLDFVISGMAFFDVNHNGVRDAGETGLKGIKVYLDANDNGQLDSTELWTITSDDRFFTPDINEIGTYSFTHLPRGTYTVREIVPSELSATPVAARSLSVELGPISKVDAHFANLYRKNEIHGVVFDDTDGDHFYDDHEATRGGVTVYIDLDRDDVYEDGEPITITGSDGAYSFTDLSPGAYIVRELSDHGPHTYPENVGGILWPSGVSNAPVGNVSPQLIQQSLAHGETLAQTISLTLPNGGGLTNMVDVFLLFDDTGSFTSNSPIVRAAFPTIISNLQAALPGVDFGFGVGRFEEYGNFAAENATGRPFTLNQPIVASATTGFETAIQSALDRMAPGFGGDGPETDIEALYQLVTGLGFDGNQNGSTLDSGLAGLAATQLTPGASGDVPSFASFQADPAHGVLPSDGSVGGAGFRSGALPIILTATDTGFAYQPKNESEIVGLSGLSLPLSAFASASRPSTPFGAGAGLQETITGLNALGALVVGLGTNADAGSAPRQSLEALAQLTGAINQSSSPIANGTGSPIAPGDPLYFQISSGFGSTVADGVARAIQNAVTNVALDITVRASDPRVQITNFTGTIFGVESGQTATFDIEFTGDGRPHRFDLQFVRAGTNVVVGSIPVVLGTPVEGDHYSYDELEDGEIHHSSHFGNYIANVAPSFVAGTDIVVSEDAGTQSIAAWATDISVGASWETRQSVDFVVSNDQPALFSRQPSIAADGTLIFTPAADAFGTANVTVQLHDDGGTGPGGSNVSETRTFVITIESVSDAPLASGDVYNGLVGEPIATTVDNGVLANDRDGDGDTITASLVDAPAHGTLLLNADGSFVYTPEPGYTGTDSFAYQASDGGLNSAATTVVLNIDRSNVVPIANDDSYETQEDILLELAAPGILANDLDEDGDTLTVSLVTAPSHGVLVLNADGSFNYTPNTNYSGTDRFTYLVFDGRSNSNVAAVDLTIVASNRPPVADDDAFSTDEDTALSVTAPGVLDGDGDLDGDTLTAQVVTGPTHGVLVLNPNGTFTYTPTLNYNGSDSFTYKVSDGRVDSNIATVALDIRAVNDGPIALGDTFAATEDTNLNVAASGVLLNDTDPEGDEITATLVRNALHGTVTLAADGSFQYIPVANFSGQDSFTYSLSDGALESPSVTVFLNVAAVNDAPVAAGNSYSAIEDNSLTIAAPGVLAGDTDLDANALRAVLVSPPTRGTLSLNANGSFVYTPSLNFHGLDTFTYKANDGIVDSNVATVTINVAPVNDSPISFADSYSTNQDEPLVESTAGVLANDLDGDGDVLTATLVAGPSHGSLVLNGDGSFSYTPATGYNGPDSFTYQASDGELSSAVTTVTLTILPPAAPNPKFFVVDATSRATYQYSETGAAITNNALNSNNKKPRGIASNDVGTIQWVVDTAGDVYVYDNNGGLLGEWSPQNVGKPEGITIWGNDLWLVDPINDRVYFFAGGANLRSGRVSATSSFALNGSNANSTDVVTDGAHLWVLNNTATNDQVFRYTTAGVLEGSWTIATTNATPTGITLDPTDVNDLWIVDSGTDRIYQYDGATGRTTGTQEPSLSYALAATNTNPQGIADPMVDAGSRSVRSIANVAQIAPPVEDRPTSRSKRPTTSEELVDQVFVRNIHNDDFARSGFDQSIDSSTDISWCTAVADKAAVTDKLSDQLFANIDDLFDIDSL